MQFSLYKMIELVQIDIRENLARKIPDRDPPRIAFDDLTEKPEDIFILNLVPQQA